MIALPSPGTPVLVTPRLTLRAFAPRAFEGFAALHYCHPVAETAP
jgi:hypothetical protein